MLNKIISDNHIEQSRRMLEKARRIVIVTHVSPDGDAIGSSLAMAHFLTRRNKFVRVIVPNNFPGFLKWADGAKDIIVEEWKPLVAADFIHSADLIFCLDFNELKRIEQLEPLVAASPAQKIMLDHHPFPADFCDLTISHPEITSTSELVFRYIYRLGGLKKMTRPCAECVYLGMMTDTGAFTYCSNNPDIYTIISILLHKGIDKDRIYDKVYNHNSESRLRLQGYVLYDKMKLYPDLHAALITLSCDEQQRFQWNKGDTEGFVNMPLSIDGIIFSVFIREEEEKIKISFRSKGRFPANRFAAEVFGGGGHLNAAGGEYYGSLDEAVAVFEKALQGYGGELDTFFQAIM